MHACECKPTAEGFGGLDATMTTMASPTPEIWGHRGWPAKHPDNTAVGFGAAFGVVETVETDVRKTTCGVLVLSHDPVIGGLTISESTWDELSSVSLGEGQRPLMLAEALAAFPDRRFDLEIKNSPFEPGFDEDGLIADEVLEHARPGDLITSFHWPTVDRIAARARSGGVATGLLVDLDMPLVDVIDHAGAAGHTVLAPSWRLLDLWGAGLAVAASHQAGMRVGVWTVTEAEDAIRFAEAGVDAIITDDPGHLVDVMASHDTQERS